MNERNNKLELLGSAPIPKALMALGIPIMIGMLINALYNLVDAYFVSGLGKSQMGAISVVFPLGQVVVGLGLMFGNGAASYLSRLLGRGDKDTADKVASTALYSSILIGAIIILLSAIFLKPILVMLGATETIMPYALTYARIYVLSCIFNVFNVTMNNIVSSEGAAKTTMCALLLGAVLNIGLDPLFIYTLDMGVEGAAIATAISQMVSTLVYLTYVLHKKSVFSFSIKEFSPTRQMITEILKIGVPTLVFQLLTSLSIALINRASSNYGDSVIAGIDNDTFCRKSPTVADYCEKWLLMQSVHVRATTLIDYTSKVRRHIIKELGQMRMADVTLDDIQLALVPVSEKSASVYKSVVILYKSIFRAAKESKIIDTNPTIYLTAKGGGVPQKDKAALTDEQAARLLDAIQGLPPYVFVMLGLYAGLRREEILALKWDSVYLDVDYPYLTVRRAWHTENNRPVILDELKTKAAERNIPLPVCLAECLKETKANSQSEYVVPNRDGDPLSYTQFKRLWQYIVTRTVRERSYYRYEDGKRVKHTVTPVLGEKAAHNGKVIYSLDFEVTPHQLRHTYITNLIHSSVDPKTVQYLAGHESSKITMDIYAKVKYNRPDELVRTMGGAFAQWDAAQA